MISNDRLSLALTANGVISAATWISLLLQCLMLFCGGACGRVQKDSRNSTNPVCFKCPQST
ncbi:hypothetical protein Mapa_000123 [Marchantia paleacea]|nr:hypothetical protein Mapa_000123 [Marchantia paleacea]